MARLKTWKRIGPDCYVDASRKYAIARIGDAWVAYRQLPSGALVQIGGQIECLGEAKARVESWRWGLLPEQGGPR